ncbi:MAG: hypothetical protein ACI38Y_03815 [Candidatus Methanomethylophilaceae archaeon]
MANRTITAVVAVAVVAIVVIAGVFVLTGDDDNVKRGLATGDSLEYSVFGSIETENGYDTITGTVEMNILDENDSQFKMDIKREVYRISPDNVRTEMIVQSETEWTYKTFDLSGLTKNGSIDADTVWGDMKTDLYQNEDRTYSILWNGDLLILAQDLTVEGRTMFYELVDISLDLGEKVVGEEHKAEFLYDVDGKVTVSGLDGTIDGEFAMSMDNRYSDIILGGPFMMDITMTFPYIGDVPMETLKAEWNTPFENKSTGVKQEGTVKVDTVWGELEADVYLEVEDGNTMTMYAYNGVPIKMSMDMKMDDEGGMMHMDVTLSELFIDGEPTDPKDVDL